jgi:hypothetical protein
MPGAESWNIVKIDVFLVAEKRMFPSEREYAQAQFLGEQRKRSG